MACQQRSRILIMRFVFFGAVLFAVIMASLPQPPQVPGQPSDKVQHIMAFAVLTVLARLAYTATKRWRLAVLRYFNPVGAHESGLIGEDPNGTPNNLMPFISRVASGRLERLAVFGDDYDTPDGTGVRDYIHVTDLAAGHLAALGAISSHNDPISTWNLGTGQGYSVLEMVDAFERVNGVSVPYQIADRRPGDVASCYASPDKAKAELGWEAVLGLEDMCASMWRFERMLATSNLPQARST